MIDLSLALKISVLSYLQTHGPMPLGELAAHFHQSVKDMHKELRELFVVELVDGEGGYSSSVPISMELEPDAAGIVSVSQIEPVAPALFTLAEIIGLLGAIDFLLSAAQESQRSSLLHLRNTLVSAAQQAGFGSVLWSAPSIRYAHDVTAMLDHAISQRRKTTFHYWKSNANARAESVEVSGYPIAIDSGYHPLVDVLDEQENIRSYRLDRIANVSISDDAISAKSFQHAQRMAKNEPMEFVGEQVILRCDPSARWVVESVPNTQFVTDDGELVITLSVVNRGWLRSLLVRLGSAVHSIEPRSFLAEDLDHIRHIREQYESIDEQ
ncbi:putative DNA-binding transcriptional regulator YafY [Arcanobacterium pluranimalium]|uniref:helix-turn-helix transcriptional regulator n=1 Tax=Arcanobacterium pluranimalium TaxID=108028 RepID=UPI001959104F|nr:WYL domain-containing protein [Arcanobacterium pluranimalium]MBM7825421.1 putative DNA-binding transcriptional regulator YafY [Arcanobacterium pluranimalium]